MVTVDLLNGRLGRCGLEVTALGLTVITGTPCVTAAVTVQLPANTDCVVVPSAAMSVASVIRPDSSLTASRPAISLPLRGGADQDRGRVRIARDLRKCFGLRRDEKVGERRDR